MLLDAARALLALLVLVSSIGCRGEVVGPERCGGCPAGGMKISMNALLSVPYITKENKTATWTAPIPDSAIVSMACGDELNSHPGRGTQQVEITWTDWDPVTTATTGTEAATTEAATTTTEVPTTTVLTTSIEGMTTDAGTTTTEAGTTTNEAGTTTTEAGTTTTEEWTTTEVADTTLTSLTTTEVPSSTESTTSPSATTTEEATTSEATSATETTTATTEAITTSTPLPTTTTAASTSETTITTTEAVITSTEPPTTTQEASSADAMTTTQAMTSTTKAETTTTEALTTTEVASSTESTTITTGAVTKSTTALTTTEITLSTESTATDSGTTEAPATTVGTLSTVAVVTTPSTTGTTEIVTETTTDSTESETVTRSTWEIVQGPITIPPPRTPHGIAGQVRDISDENNKTEGLEVTPSSEEADEDTGAFSVVDKNIFRQVRQADTEPQTPVHGAGQKGTTRMVSPNSSRQNRLVLRFKQDDETYHVNELELRIDLTSFNIEDIEDSPRMLRAVSSNLGLFPTPVNYTHDCESFLVPLDSAEAFYINFTDIKVAAFLPSESTCEFPPDLWMCGMTLPTEEDSDERQVLLLALGITLGVIVVIALALHLLKIHCRSHNASRSSGPA